MSSLRHLLGTDFKSEMDIYGQVPSPLHDGKVVMYNYGHDCCCWDCGWNGQRRHMWCAPLGTCRITFEAWGGSGGAASSCCCAMSTGGTTGAYVRKTVCGSLAGNCYCICIGRVEGGNGDVTSKRGCRGCWTTICGRGVHMCAEGGYGGCAICNLVQPAGSGSYHGQSRIVLFDNATQPDNCVEFGPQGYGGDLNVRGRTGWFRYHCDDNCSVFWHIPSPPYLGHLASCSYVATKHCQQNTCAYFYMKSSYGGFTGAVGATSNYSNSGSLEYHSSPFPWMHTQTTGSCCVHGTPSSAGMVRITYQGCRCGQVDPNDSNNLIGLSDCYHARYFCN